jgi:all-trans-retinol 13,14-reductase
MLEQHDVTGGGTHSFREHGCEWDTGLHYSSAAMSQKTARPGAIMDYMTKGKQKFQQIPEPCDEIFFPDGRSYPYMNGKTKTIDALVDDRELKRRVTTYMDIYTDVHKGFVALGLSRILPPCLQFLVRSRVNRLMKYGALTVRDVQNAVLTLGYSKEQILDECPKAPPGRDSNDTIQRLKAILAHPIGDYGVQPRDASMAAHGVTAQHYIDGGSYTVGPTQNISVHLTSLVRAYGGEVLVDATVRQILIEDGRAVGVLVSNTSDMEKMGETAPITEIRAKQVVCGTTAYNLYNSLLPQYLSVVQKFHDPSECTIRQSNGHMFVFCKIKGDPDDLPDHNLWYFNGDELDTAFDKFYANPVDVRPPVVYIGFPCTKDPTWKKRFPGVSNCIVISDG